MENRKYLKVLYDDLLVGKLAYTKDKYVIFQYDESWIKNGFSLNPFFLPLDSEPHINVKKPYMPHSVFLDSLPDAWGQLLLSKKLLSEGIDVNSLNILDKLSLIVDKRKGRLRYEPSSKYKKSLYEKVNLDKIQDFVLSIIKEKNISDTVFLDKLYRQAGSTGGARPKINLLIDGDLYIVKFAAHTDPVNIGENEYNYNVLAKKCEIFVSDFLLLPSKNCSGYFATKRFDDIYTVTIAGLLEVDYNIPSLDYSDIFKLVKILTNDKESELYEMYKRMCFNVYAGNQDDHAKNFSMQYYIDKGIWRLSPAYDLTKSSTSFGEQTTTVNGKGKNITKEDLLKVGLNAGLKKDKLIDITDRISDVVNNRV